MKNYYYSALLLAFHSVSVLKSRTKQNKNWLKLTKSTIHTKYLFKKRKVQDFYVILCKTEKKLLPNEHWLFNWDNLISIVSTEPNARYFSVCKWQLLQYLFSFLLCEWLQPSSHQIKMTTIYSVNTMINERQSKYFHLSMMGFSCIVVVTIKC